MNDDSSLSPNPPTIRIQQTAERIEGDARIIGLNITIDEVNLHIHLPGDTEADTQPTMTQLVMTVNDPTTDIVPLVETWLKALLGANVRIVVERDDDERK